MKGFVPTPPHLVDTMVAKLFQERPPRPDDRVLDPGCGTGAFIEGVVRWCKRGRVPLPQIVGVDSDPSLLAHARNNVPQHQQISIQQRDFLTGRFDPCDYIIGNPPYIGITGLSVDERIFYRQRYHAARGRFDLYLLFFEQALGLLKPGGRLVFVTPEKFLYVQTAAPLRRQLAQLTVEEIELVDESSFEGLVTYPTITTVVASTAHSSTRITLRNGTTRLARLSPAGSSWMPLINGTNGSTSGPTLSDVCLRVSCGVATGADEVFVLDNGAVPDALQPFAFRTIAGRELGPGRELLSRQSMLLPYTGRGVLLPERDLGALGRYLCEPSHRMRLMQRTCVSRKPWYAFHETPPLNEILRPKILCKDIGARPWFVVDEQGDIVPRHSVYYLVPKSAGVLQELCAFLNSPDATDWLLAHCQRAANGFIRLQSHVLKTMPVAQELAQTPQLAMV